MSNDNKALIALMDLVLAIADLSLARHGETREPADRVRAERREVAGWRETLHLLCTEANRRVLEDAVKQKAAREMDEAFYGRSQQPTGRPGLGAVVADGQEAKAAVEATVRHWKAYAEKQRRGSEGVGVCPSRWMLAQELKDLAGEPVDPIEADDSRVTDGHQCCGGKPDCGCRSVGG